ncbi:hypothetical protein [Xanthocytophaga agilis]
MGSSGEFAENDLKSELDIIQINCTSLTALTHFFAGYEAKKIRHCH